MHRCLLAFVSLVLLPPFASAQVWHLADCPPEQAESRNEYRQHLEELKPGDRGYRPHPFPTTTDEVVENFLTFHRRAYSDTAFEDLRPGEQRLFALVDSGQAKYTLRRVANWTPTRCRERERQDYYYVVQVIDSKTGVEVTRFSVDEEGDVAVVAHRYVEPDSENDLEPISDLRVVETAELPHAISTSVKNPQYVNLWGSVRCTVLFPCVAFKASGQTFFMKDQALYRVETDRERMKVAEEMGSPTGQQAFYERLAARDEMFVSIGGSELAYLSQVEP